MVPNTETLCLETILSGETACPWQLPHSDSVDLRIKRKAFDIIVSLRRLQEEQKILVAEMDNHWKYLSTRADTFRELSCLFASIGLPLTKYFPEKWTHKRFSSSSRAEKECFKFFEHHNC